MADVVSIGAGVTLVCDMTGVTFCTEDLTLVSGVYGTSINLGSGTGGLVLTSSGPSVTIIAGDLVMTTGPQGIQAQGGLLPFTFGF